MQAKQEHRTLDLQASNIGRDAPQRPTQKNSKGNQRQKHGSKLGSKHDINMIASGSMMESKEGKLTEKHPSHSNIKER